ncbi:MAG: hypothetical protein J2P59_10055, partial [Acidimicrobiales bacterium]|nr:hypothetical protein [Acidimicrobiales bacterium]
LQRVSRELERQTEREAELRRRLADAEYRASHPKLDEAALTTALGEETARVLRSAFDAAHEVRAKAEEGSARVMAEATERAGRVRQEAENEVAERRRAADAEAERVLEAARAEAGGILEESRRQGRGMLEEAQQLRSRVLGDLSRRRQVLHDHVERLRAGRESLLVAVREAVTSLERVEHGLRGAEDESRPAPEGPEAGPGSPGSPTSPEELPGVGAAPAPTTGAEPGAVAASPSEGTEQVATLEDRPPAEDRASEAGPVEAGPSEAGQPSGAATEGAVGQLFARIKAAQSEPRVAERVRAASAPDESTAPADQQPSRASVPGDTDARPAGPAEEALLEQREAVIGPLGLNLARRLKRALQDEQNALLDQLRRQSRRGPVPYLPPEGEQRERFRRAAADVLVQAERAGAQVAAGPAGLGAGAGESGAKEADALAEEVATALRRRLEERVGALGGSDHSSAVEAVGATYREWRGTRIERAAMDHVVAAYSSGVVASTPKGTTLRWVSHDEDGECADCDDNALAGALPPGEAFPTGQIHPPAHSGCRCLLAPAAT